MLIWTSGQSSRSSQAVVGVMTGLAWVFSFWTASMWTVESRAAEPNRTDSVVGWNDVRAAFGHDAVASRPTVRRSAGEFSIDRAGAALPPPPREGLVSTAGSVHPSSLAGISSAVIPSVTGDLYWSRPSLDMRVIGQSLGQQSSLYLSRPSVGVSVGSTTNTPPFVGIK